MAVMGLWALILCTGLADDIKQKNKIHETIPSRFSLNRKQRSLFFNAISVQYTKFWLEFGIHKYLDKLSIHLVRECVLWLSVWTFKEPCLWQPCLNKLMHVKNWRTDNLQQDLYVDISYKYTLAWVFVSHACTQITMNTYMIWYFLQE